MARDPFKHHAHRIAVQTMRMPDALLGVMGGSTKRQASLFLEQGLSHAERSCLAEARSRGAVRSGHVFSKRLLRGLAEKGLLRLRYKGSEFDTYEPIS